MVSPLKVLVAVTLAGWLFGSVPSTAQTLTLLHNFHGERAPSSLTFHGGLLYGTTEFGGTSKLGTVFFFNPVAGVNVHILHSFTGGADGANPITGLVYQDGFLYGTTQYGGNGSGTVFKVDATTGAETVLYSFPDAHYSYGSQPSSLLSEGGLLYGTTEFGASGGGTVFEIDPTTGSQTVLHAFGVGNDGAFPVGGLTYHDGLLYGVTVGSSISTCGDAFSVDATTGAEAVLHVFRCSSASDGSIQDLNGPLVYQNGALWGTSASGGTSLYCGTVYRLDLATRVARVIHSFGGKGDGCNPTNGLIFHHGVFYGTTAFTSDGQFGLLFSLQAASGSEVVLDTFPQSYPGGLLYPSMLTLQGGTLYGTTGLDSYFKSGIGTIFKLTP